MFIINLLCPFKMSSMKYLLFVISLVFHFPSLPQELTRSDQLFKDLQILSADSLEGRKTGSNGNKSARNYIIKRFEEIGVNPIGGEFTKTFKIDNIDNLQHGTNIIGWLEGDIEDLVVVSAHYDHLGKKGREIFNGSDDNASGVSLMLYLANIIKNSHRRHTYLFVAFDAEEIGLLGAHAFVDDPPFPLDRMVLNVNFDMVSRSQVDELFVSGTGHYAEYRPYIKDWRSNYPIKLRFGHDDVRDKKNDWTNSSDHGAFHQKGIPYLYFGVADHNDYHKPTDTYERVDRTFFTKVSATLADMLVKLDGLNLRELK